VSLSLVHVCTYLFASISFTISCRCQTAINQTVLISQNIVSGIRAEMGCQGRTVQQTEEEEEYDWEVMNPVEKKSQSPDGCKDGKAYCDALGRDTVIGSAKRSPPRSALRRESSGSPTEGVTRKRSVSWPDDAKLVEEHLVPVECTVVASTENIVGLVVLAVCAMGWFLLNMVGEESLDATPGLAVDSADVSAKQMLLMLAVIGGFVLQIILIMACVTYFGGGKDVQNGVDEDTGKDDFLAKDGSSAAWPRGIDRASAGFLRMTS